uniref:Uncharacterized protein n=1 Tax=Anguilla anguilla TaxID=7936 RepID=A0A0E9SLE1_ANGAN
MGIMYFLSPPSVVVKENRLHSAARRAAVLGRKLIFFLLSLPQNR